MSIFQTPISHRLAPQPPPPTMYLVSSIAKPMRVIKHVKRKRLTSKSIFYMKLMLRPCRTQTIISYNLFLNHFNRERRRLKKLRKDKLRQLSFTDDPNAKHKRKHKHKCGDELCKHRKHKKRRKHKKHHHNRAIIAESSPMLMPQNLNEEEEEQCDSGSGSASVDSNEPAPLVIDEKEPETRKIQNARSVLTKSVNIKLNKLEWPIDDDLISSVTEDSSGSSYVSLIIRKFITSLLSRNSCKF